MLRNTLLDFYRMDETLCVENLLEQINFSPSELKNIEKTARQLIENVRKKRLSQKGLDAFFYEYDLSSQEGIALMCLAEALLRIPDAKTREKLIQDKLTSLDWLSHLDKNKSFFVNASAFGLMLAGKLKRISLPIMLHAMKLLGEQFVMGETIQEALEKRKKTYTYSYDMLGEAARTMNDADRYFQAYQAAISQGVDISVKLSALHPRYEFSQRERVLSELVPRVRALALQAKTANINLTIDAEEADRLDLSLDIFEAVFNEGVGLAVQAYQKRALPLLDWLIDLARERKQRVSVRLVKGAYWDTEIKATQVQGLEGYPVFTRKVSTDVSYLACAKKMLDATDAIYPQFATHNAYSVAAILEMAGASRDFEFQCLHGMGYSLYDQLIEKFPCRVYAPVGNHEDLLAYLVRRLLENGANNSFVNHILDEQIPIEQLVADPIAELRSLASKPNPHIPLPKDLFGDERKNSQGLDLSNVRVIQQLMESLHD